MEVWNEILRIIFDQISKRDMSVYKDFIKYIITQACRNHGARVLSVMHLKICGHAVYKR